jgi:hypothetical protein
VTEFLEHICCEVEAVVGDDVVGDPKSVDYSIDEFYSRVSLYVRGRLSLFSFY